MATVCWFLASTLPSILANCSFHWSDNITFALGEGGGGPDPPTNTPLRPNSEIWSDMERQRGVSLSLASCLTHLAPPHRPVPRGEGVGPVVRPPPNSTKVHFFRLLILYLFQNVRGQAPNSPGLSSLVHISSQTTPPPKKKIWAGYGPATGLINANYSMARHPHGSSASRSYL